ncbi:MAG: hypothetical protein MJ104_04255, partial [Lachnospiraceae bacterium]|nr:hypothetical protein [Lachnospiraceae bacterium]
MFKNVGNKIKTVSVLLLIAGILLSAYIGIFGHMISGGEASSSADELILGVVIIVFGVIASVVLSLIVNGFGVIVENAEMLDEIRTLVLEIDNKQSSHRPDNKKSASILNSSFNSEVFDDRDFSAEEPANPDYVKPVPGHEVAASRYVPPTYSGHGKETRAPKTGFGTQNMGDDYLPAQETPITGAFDEPDFEEFSEPAPQSMQQRVPQPAAQPAPQPMQQRAPQPAAQPAPQS